MVFIPIIGKVATYTPDWANYYDFGIPSSQGWQRAEPARRGSRADQDSCIHSRQSCYILRHALFCFVSLPISFPVANKDFIVVIDSLPWKHFYSPSSDCSLAQHRCNTLPNHRCAFLLIRRMQHLLQTLFRPSDLQMHSLLQLYVSSLLGMTTFSLGNHVIAAITHVFP